MSKLVLLAAVLVVSVFVSGAAEVQAQGSNAITFRVKSLHPNIVDLEFYSQSRRGHVWPGGGQVYTLRDSQSHHHDLACNAGEKVCYGAWVRGGGNTYWGAGRGGRQACTNCCRTCGSGAHDITLNP